MKSVETTLAILKAQALQKVSPSLALPLLKQLEKEVPFDMQIKRLLAECYFELGMFEDALPVWLFIFIHEGEEDSLWHLLSCCYATQKPSHFLQDSQLLPRLTEYQIRVAEYLLEGNKLQDITNILSHRYSSYILSWHVLNPTCPDLPANPVNFSLFHEYILWCIYKTEYTTAIKLLKDIFRSGGEEVVVSGDRQVVVSGGEEMVVSGDRQVVVSGDEEMVVSGDRQVVVSGDEEMVVNGDGQVVRGNVEQAVESGDGQVVRGNVEQAVVSGDEETINNFDKQTVENFDENILLEHLKERQKLEILYFLKKHTAFGKYYDEAIKDIEISKVKIVYLLLKTGSRDLKEFIKFGN